MDSDTDLNGVKLSCLTIESRSWLSSLLNTKKILLTVGPDPLYRDWRGLASLVNISSELAASIKDCVDKTGTVLDIWIKKNDGTATVGNLLEYLQRIDRYDVYDDLLVRAINNELVSKKAQVRELQPATQVCNQENESGFLTYDDMEYGMPQYYDVYILYARDCNDDSEFSEKLKDDLSSRGLRVCTEDRLLPGLPVLATLTQLLAERCRRTVVVYSPDFLESPEDTFCMNFVQAYGIGNRKQKLIPLLYRPCQLPLHVSFIHRIVYRPGDLQFWNKMHKALAAPDPESIPLCSSIQSSGVLIQEMSNGYMPSSLLLPEVPKETSSMLELHTISGTVTTAFDSVTTNYDTKSLNAVKTSKKNRMSKWFNFIKGKKTKKAICS